MDFTQHPRERREGGACYYGTKRNPAECHNQSYKQTDSDQNSLWSPQEKRSQPGCNTLAAAKSEPNRKHVSADSRECGRKGELARAVRP